MLVNYVFNSENPVTGLVSAGIKMLVPADSRPDLIISSERLAELSHIKQADLLLRDGDYHIICNSTGEPKTRITNPVDADGNAKEQFMQVWYKAPGNGEAVEF